MEGIRSCDLPEKKGKPACPDLPWLVQWSHLMRRWIV